MIASKTILFLVKYVVFAQEIIRPIVYYTFDKQGKTDTGL